MRYLTADPRESPGYAARTGSIVYWVSNGATLAMVKYGTGLTDWCVRPLAGASVPVLADPRVSGRAAPVNASCMYVSSGVGTLLRKYGVGATDWTDVSGGTTGSVGSQGPSGEPGPPGADGAPGPPGPAPSGTGFVKVTSGVLETPNSSIAISSIAGLQVALDNKQPTGSYSVVGHTHTIANVTSLVTALDGKAATSHTHAIADTTGLQSALDGKQAAGSYAAATHTHAQADVTNLTTDLAAKAPTARTIATTAPLAGGGDLSANRTLTVATFGAAAAGVVPASGGGSTNFLRADGTWAAPGGGSDPWTYVKLAADFTTSAATNTIVTGFSFTPAANQTYVIEGFFLVRTAAQATGARPGLAWPTGTTDGAAAVYVANSAILVQYGAGNPTGGTFNSAGTGLPTITTSWPGSLEATVITGPSPSGVIQVTLASETAGTNVTMKVGSWIRYRTI